MTTPTAYCASHRTGSQKQISYTHSYCSSLQSNQIYILAFLELYLTILNTPPNAPKRPHCDCKVHRSSTLPTSFDLDIIYLRCAFKRAPVYVCLLTACVHVCVSMQQWVLYSCGHVQKVPFFLFEVVDASEIKTSFWTLKIENSKNAFRVMIFLIFLKAL